MKHQTVEEYARDMRINKETVRRMCRDGRIEAVKVGSVWRIPAEERDDALSRRVQQLEARITLLGEVLS